MNNYFDNAADSWDQDPVKVERAKATAGKIKELELELYASMVDFGCGTGLLGLCLSNIFAKVILADSSSRMLQVAQDKISAVKIENVETRQVEKLSELTSQYSAIATLMTLHHITDIDEFFSDANSRLEHNGHLIIADLYQEDGSFHKHNPSFDGHNGFDVAELTALAERAGFSVQGVEPYYDLLHENFEGEVVPYPLFLFVARKTESQV